MKVLFWVLNSRNGPLGYTGKFAQGKVFAQEGWMFGGLGIGKPSGEVPFAERLFSPGGQGISLMAFGSWEETMLSEEQALRDGIASCEAKGTSVEVKGADVSFGLWV
jgi:hypothetical protein